MQQLVDEDGAHAHLLVIRMDGHQQEVDGVVLDEGPQKRRPAGGQELAVVGLQGVGDAGRAHAHGDHFVLLVHHKAGELRVDQGRKLGGVLGNLLVGEFHGAIQGRVAFVHQLEEGGQQRNVGQPGLRGVFVHGVVVGDVLAQALPLGHAGVVGGDGDEVFHPVDVLHVAQALQMLGVVGEVVVGEEAAAAVEALNQHALPI